MNRVVLLEIPVAPSRLKFLITALKIPCAKSGIAFHVRAIPFISLEKESAFERASRVEKRAEELPDG